MLRSYGGNRSFTSRSDFFARGLAARPRLGDDVSDDAELAQRAEVVPARPVLDGLAAFEAVDVNLILLDLPARGRDAHELALVRAGEGAAQHNRLALGDHLFFGTR